MTLRDRGLPEQFMVDGDQSLLKEMEASHDKNAQANQTYWLEGTNDVRYKVGDASIWNESYHHYPSSQRPQYTFPKIRKIINLISGHQRRGRKATSAFPMEGADEETADQLTTVTNWAYQRINTYHTISEAFEGGLTTGMNMLSIWMDYRTDPINGDIRIDNISYNGVLMDQSFTKTDLPRLHHCLWSDHTAGCKEPGSP